MNAVAQMPIGRIINSSRAKTPTTIYSAPRPSKEAADMLEEKLSKIIDIITYRLPIRGVEATYESIKTDIFSLRFDMLDEITIDQIRNISESDFNEYKTLSGLNSLVSDILPIYLEIMQALLASTYIQNNTPYVQNKKIDRISLDDFYIATSFLPNEQAQVMNAFIEDSIRIEFAMIATDCFADEKKLTPLAASDLYDFLKLAFERYAARAATFKIWDANSFQPTSQLLRNIQIVKSTMQVKGGAFSFQTNNLQDIKTHFEQAI